MHCADGPCSCETDTGCVESRRPSLSLSLCAQSQVSHLHTQAILSGVPRRGVAWVSERVSAVAVWNFLTRLLAAWRHSAPTERARCQAKPSDPRVRTTTHTRAHLSPASSRWPRRVRQAVIERVRRSNIICLRKSPHTILTNMLATPQVTTSASTSRTSRSRTSAAATCAVTRSRTRRWRPPRSSPRSSC